MSRRWSSREEAGGRLEIESHTTNTTTPPTPTHIGMVKRLFRVVLTFCVIESGLVGVEMTEA